MLRALVKTCALAGCIVSVPVSMTAQQVVHALDRHGEFHQ